MSDERIVQLKALSALQSGAWGLWTNFPLAQIGADLILESDMIQLSESLQVSQSCSYLRTNADKHWPSYDRHSSPINTIKKSLRGALLWIYLLCLLNLPNFYASRLLMWAQNTEPLSETCPTRNSSLWMFDNQLDCDVEFCNRVLITFLREWKTLRIFSTVLFASILAMLQISRVESDLVVGFPAYLSLICGIMAAVSATVLDLYFQSGKSSPSILAWVNSLRTISPPQHFNDDSVVLAIPAISAAWCTILFVLSIITFALRAYTDHNVAGAEVNNLPIGASSAFRVVFAVFTGVGIMFLIMVFATLRRISKGYERGSHSIIALCVR